MTLAKNIAASGVIVSFAVYLVGIRFFDFPPPPGPLIVAVVGLLFWAIEQLLDLVPGTFLRAIRLNSSRPAMYGGVGGTATWAVVGDPLVASAVGLYGYLTTRANHVKGTRLPAPKAK